MAGIQNDVQALKQIALNGAINGFVEVSSAGLGKMLGVSQQTASRRIRDLEKLGYIRREMGVHRQLLHVTRSGLNALQNEFTHYQKIFEMKDRLEITGKVTSGLGEGAYYLAQAKYTVQFQERLGFTPYPGTLNLQIVGAEANKLRILRSTDALQIDGFEDQGRTFGEVDAWRASLDGYACAVILPRRTHHARTIELIAEDQLRGRFALKDGDQVQVRVEL